MLFYDPQNNDPRICRNVRTKMSYSPSGAEGHLAELSPSAIYWCTCTQGVTGPDGHVATPWECQKDRPCFESTEQ